MSSETMQYRNLGRCGTKTSAVSLGGWTTFGGSVTDRELTKAILTGAFEGGINFFDIADVYSNGQAEIEMGKVLGDLPRHELVISTKVFGSMSEDVNDRGLSRKHIMESVEKSLKRIGTDYLDIYFCHRYDKETPLEETARAMDDLVHQGKVLQWGTSMWSAGQLAEAHGLADARNLYAPRVEQPQYSLLARQRFEKEILPVIERTGMGVVVYSPLACGVLTGKYDEGIPDDSRLAHLEWLQKRWFREEVLQRVRDMKHIADDLGCTRAQLALAWAIAQPGVTSVITGATRPEQVEENLKAAEIEITPDAMEKLDELFPVEGV